MNRDEIIRMAREALLPSCHLTHPKALERFAALVAAAERERIAFELAEAYRCGWDGGVKAEREECAKVCDEIKGVKLQGYEFADAIRARSEK